MGFFIFQIQQNDILIDFKWEVSAFPRPSRNIHLKY